MKKKKSFLWLKGNDNMIKLPIDGNAGDTGYKTGKYQIACPEPSVFADVQYRRNEN